MPFVTPMTKICRVLLHMTGTYVTVNKHHNVWYVFTNTNTCTHINPLLTFLYPSLSLSLSSSLSRVNNDPSLLCAGNVLFAREHTEKSQCVSSQLLRRSFSLTAGVSSFSSTPKYFALLTPLRKDSCLFSRQTVSTSTFSLSHTCIDYSLMMVWMVCFAWPVTSFAAACSAVSQSTGQLMFTLSQSEKKRPKSLPYVARLKDNFNVTHLTCMARVKCRTKGKFNTVNAVPVTGHCTCTPLLLSVIQCVKLTSLSASSSPRDTLCLHSKAIRLESACVGCPVHPVTVCLSEHLIGDFPHFHLTPWG